MNVRFFNPGKGYLASRDEVLKELDRILTAGDLIMRDDVEKFEKSLANYVGTKYAIGLNSGTDALYLSLWALGIGPGDDVLVPSHTFVATAQVVKQLGANPILYDLDGTFELTPNTKAIIPAHIAGEFGANMPMLMEICQPRGIHVIEDACQSLGAVQAGQYAGSFGITGCFSFYPAKILGAYGDAGAVVTNDENIANTIRELRNHWKSDYSRWGVNSRLDNIQAAILNIKMKQLPSNHIRRAAIAEMYRELGDVVELPRYTEGRVWQDYIIRTKKRDELYDFLKRVGVETMKNEYPFPIPKMPKSLEYEAETLRLPCNDLLEDEEVQYVIEMVKKFFTV